MTPVSSSMLAPASLTPSQGSDREQLAEAARKFEAIFLRQMLAAARKTDFGAPLLGGEGLKTFRTMQDEHFADLASKSGAFGLAAQIEASLQLQLDRTSPSRLREGLGEGLLASSSPQALPQPLPQAVGETKDSGFASGGAS